MVCFILTYRFYLYLRWYSYEEKNISRLYQTYIELYLVTCSFNSSFTPFPAYYYYTFTSK